MGLTAVVPFLGCYFGETGLGEEDLAASIATLTRVCDGIGASLIHLRTKSETEGRVAEFLVRAAPTTGDFMDIRVAVVGNVDAGKRYVPTPPSPCSIHPSPFAFTS